MSNFLFHICFPRKYLKDNKRQSLKELAKNPNNSIYSVNQFDKFSFLTNQQQRRIAKFR